VTEITEKLKQSGARLGALTTDALTKSGEGFESFLTRTRSARAAFFDETRDAGAALLAETREAGLELVRAFGDEASTLRELLLPSVPQLPAPSELKGEVGDTTTQLQVRLLSSLKEALGTMDRKVAERLDALGPTGSKKAPAKKAKKASAKKSAPAKKSAKAPLSGYDELTAKEVVAQLAELAPAQVDAVVAYEKAHKNRRTVLKAAARKAA